MTIEDIERRAANNGYSLCCIKANRKTLVVERRLNSKMYFTYHLNGNSISRIEAEDWLRPI